jgi:GntR family transcriptional regulator/MocR family aminotransferase
MISGRQSDGLVQAALAALMDDGAVQRHVRRTRRVLHARRDAALASVRAAFGDRLALTAPAGGMTLWARAPRDLDLPGWKRAARAAGMHLRLGREFDFDGRATPAVRLGFGQFEPREFARALRALARCLPRG